MARLRGLVKQIKVHTADNESIGAALGIEGQEQTGPDLSTLAPVPKLELSGGGVMIRWGWQRYSQFLDTCELQVDRGAGAGWQVLAFDTTPNYLDTQPPPHARRQMEIPRHLPHRRPARRPVEQRSEPPRRRLTPSRHSPSALTPHE